jgi:hypothetical protein
LTSICACAAPHCCGDTIGGVLIAVGLFPDDVCMVDLLRWLVVV